MFAEHVLQRPRRRKSAGKISLVIATQTSYTMMSTQFSFDGEMRGDKEGGREEGRSGFKWRGKLVVCSGCGGFQRGIMFWLRLFSFS